MNPDCMTTPHPSRHRRFQPCRPRRQRLGGVERLESRHPLAADTFSPPLPAISALVGSGWTAAAAAPAAPQAANSLLASVVPYADTLFGDTQVVAADTRCLARDLVPYGREFRSEVPIAIGNVPLGATVRLEILTGLTSWTGRGKTSDFRPVPRGLELNLQVAGTNLRVGALTNRGQPPQGGEVRQTLTLAASDGQPIDRRLAVTIGSGGVADRFTKPGAPAGLYAFTGLLSIGGIDTVRPSQPVTFVFRIGEVADAAVTAAVAAFSAPASRPRAVLAVAARSAGNDRPFANSLLVTLDYSDPVTVSQRTPHLPIFLDGIQRMATLPADAPRSNVTQLTFTYIPRGRERDATVITVGDSLLLPPGATISTPVGGAAVTSLPTEGGRGIPLELQATIEHVSADITRNTTFRAGTTYVVTSEVHVAPGVTLTIEDGVQVQIRNGSIAKRYLSSPALIFDTGSRLRAKTVSFIAGDDGDRPATTANNGGVFFCGAFRNASKDGISTRTGVGVRDSSFIAERIACSFLGRTDPLAGDDDVTTDDRDDIDAISLLGLGPTEWRIGEVSSTNSGDDGFDVTNSSIFLTSLMVVNPVEDGLNISSSLVQINGGCTVAMSRSTAPDRELFDLETDDGPSRIVLQRLTAVDLRGYFGDRYDEVRLTSPDMPQPDPLRKSFYEFVGILRRGPAVIYSIAAD